MISTYSIELLYWRTMICHVLTYSKAHMIPAINQVDGPQHTYTAPWRSGCCTYYSNWPPS